MLGRLRGYLVISPAVLYTLLLSIFPLLYVIWLSTRLTDIRTNATTFAGLKNYATILQDPLFWTAAWQSTKYVVVGAVLHLALGLAMAGVLVQSEHWAVKRLSRTLVILPWTLTPAVVGGLWRLIYNPELSVIPSTLAAIGIKVDWQWLGNPTTALWAVVVTNVWLFTPFYMLMLLARLQAIPKELYEAAAMDGARAGETFRFVTLPMLRPLLYTLAAFDVIGSFIQFDLIWVMTKGGPLNSTEVLATYIYRLAFERFDFGLAAAGAVILFILLGAVSGLLLARGGEGTA